MNIHREGSRSAGILPAQLEGPRFWFRYTTHDIPNGVRGVRISAPSRELCAMNPSSIVDVTNTGTSAESLQYRHESITTGTTTKLPQSVFTLNLILRQPADPCQRPSTIRHRNRH